jgi:hypothetical protein
MAVTLTTRDAKTSYALGLDVASSLSRLPLAFDLAAFHQGMSDLLAAAELQVAPDECRRLLGALQQAARQQATEAQGDAGARNL